VAESLAKLLLHQRAWLRQYAPFAAAPDGGGDGDGVAASGRLPARLPPVSRQQQARLLQRGLALLLQLQFHPATESSSQLCQCLSVFFDVFAAAADGNRLQLAAACLPAARQSLHVTAKRAPAPLLVKYVLQLLASAARPADEGEAGRSGGAGVWRQRLGEGQGVLTAGTTPGAPQPVHLPHACPDT
jgi:hypothetical protein